MEKSHVDTRASRRRFKTLRRRLTSMMMLLVILVPFVQAAGMPGRMISAEPGALTIAYDNDENGSAPESDHAWRPENQTDQTDVLNPLGGNTKTGQLTGHGIETIAPGDSRTLLQFGEDGYQINTDDPKKSNPAYSISKYATQTKTPGRYNVTLTATGNNTTKETAKPLEIVFVVDMSGSMERAGSTRLQSRYEYTESGKQYIRSAVSMQSRNGGWYFQGDTIPGQSEKLEQYSLADADDYGGGYSNDPTDYRFKDASGKWYAYFKDSNGRRTQYQLYQIESLVGPSLNPEYSSETRASYLRSGMQKTLNLIKQEQNSGQLSGKVSVGMVGFSDQSSMSNDTVVWLSEFNDAQEDAINNALDPDFSGGTWTQNGLERGANMFSSDSNASKIMILLTDGQPTVAGENGRIGNGSETTDEVWDATKLAASSIQKKIHVQGISIDTPQNQVANFEDLTSKKPNSNEPDYVPVANGDAIADALMADVKFDIENFTSPNTVSNGQINDPLGEKYKYVGKDEANVTGTNLTQQQIDAVKLQLDDQLESDDSKLTIEGLNLGKGQTIKITYQVQLQTESEGFIANHWYPMNGETTFKPRSTDSTTVDFGIPSGRAPSVNVPVEKVWKTLDKTTKLPDSLLVTIRRSKQTEKRKEVDSEWSKTFSLNNSDNWNGSISAPAYDNSGKAFSYFVSDESKDGYADPDSYILSSTGTGTAEDPVIATNQQYGFQFVKRDADSGDEVKSSSMNFSLTPYNESYTRKIGDTITDLNEATPHALAPGYYGIQETTAPDGYVLDGTKYYFQLTSQGTWNYFGTNNPNSTGTSITASQLLKTVGEKQDAFKVTGEHQNILQLTKYDKPKPTVPLTVVKTDNQGTPLAGAKFTLTGTNQASQSLTSDGNKDGQQFTQQLQANGSYTLSETQAPLGYQKSSASVSIKINDEGKVESVTINGKELQSGETSLGYKLAATNDGTALTLTIENQPLPVLPHTGGQGMVRAAAFALMMLVVAAVLAVVVWIKRRGGANS